MEHTYTIQQIANETGISVHTLRYYEKAGLLEGIDRDEHGYRQYSRGDVEWIDFLVCLRRMGMSIKEIKLYSDLRHQGPSTMKERREMLEKHQEKVGSQINELQKNWSRIEKKISYYKTLEGDS